MRLKRGERVGASPGNPPRDDPGTDHQPWDENLMTLTSHLLRNTKYQNHHQTPMTRRNSRNTDHQRASSPSGTRGRSRQTLISSSQSANHLCLPRAVCLEGRICPPAPQQHAPISSHPPGASPYPLPSANLPNTS